MNQFPQDTKTLKRKRRNQCKDVKEEFQEKKSGKGCFASLPG